MVAIGLADRPDLLLAAAAHRGDKTQLDQITEQAVEAARAHAAATVGTALHAITQQIDTGQPVGPLPGEYEADIDAYTAATVHLKMLHVEQFVVLDDLKIGGTPDRVVEYDGHHYIADVKTGSIEYGAGAIAMQLAVYAHSRLYNPRTGERTPLDVHQDKAVVIHLPAGTGTCTLHWVNITAGWEAVQHATWVRAWRARKNLIAPADTPAAISNLAQAGLIDDPIEAQIDAAQTVLDLTRVWAENVRAWTDQHTQQAVARKAQLTSEGARE